MKQNGILIKTIMDCEIFSGLAAKAYQPSRDLGPNELEDNTCCSGF